MNKALDCFALTIVIIGAINWGLIGFFRFDLVAAIFGNMSDIHPVNNTVKYIDKLRGHRRDGKLEHQSAYGCLAKICCCVHFNFPHPFDRDCRTCMCSSPCILIIVNFNRYGQKKL